MSSTRSDPRLAQSCCVTALFAIGWFNLSFNRFLIGTTILSLTYLPTVFAIVYVLGGAAFSHLGNWTWVIVLVPLTVLLVLRARAYFRRPGLGATTE